MKRLSEDERAYLELEMKLDKMGYPVPEEEEEEQGVARFRSPSYLRGRMTKLEWSIVGVITVILLANGAFVWLIVRALIKYIWG